MIVTPCPGFNVSGTCRPVPLNSDPTTEMDEMVKGRFPVELNDTDRVAVCPTFTAPNETLVLPIESAAAAAFS